MLERIKEYLDSFDEDSLYLIPENIVDDLKLELICSTHDSFYIYYCDDDKSWYNVNLCWFTEKATVVKVVPKQITKTIWEEV